MMPAITLAAAPNTMAASGKRAATSPATTDPNANSSDIEKPS